VTRKIGGPWARIIRDLKAGADTLAKLRDVAPGESRVEVKSQLHKMVRVGLVDRSPEGLLSLTAKGEAQS
jgi:hypothetical protein